MMKDTLALANIYLKPQVKHFYRIPRLSLQSVGEEPPGYPRSDSPDPNEIKYRLILNILLFY